MKNILCCLALAVIACTARALPPTILGSLYSKNSWTTTSDFIPNGTSTVALSSGFIRLGVNGTPDFTYPGSNSIYITSYQTKLEKWNLKARFKILSNGVGIGFGLNSSNSVSSARHDIMGFVQTIAGGDGDLYLMNTRGQKLVSFQHNHYAINDIIDVELDFNVNVVNFTIQNQTNGETHTLSYTYSSTSNQYVVPNTSHFALMELGGSHELRDLQVSSNEITYSNLVVIGDSKTSSQYADAFSLRYAEQLKALYPATVISAGGGDMIENALARLDELIALRPQRYLISIGSNDLRHGNALMQTQYETLVNALLATGASVYHMVFPEVPSKPNAVDMTGFKNWIETTYNSDYIPEVWNNLSTSNVLKPGYDAGDGYHLNQAANNMIYMSIRDHGELPNQHALPVRLISFQAIGKEDGPIALSWITDPAEQADMYVLQRSTDGLSFHDLVTISVNTTGIYGYTDTFRKASKIYYRLRFREKGGAVSFSSIVSCATRTQKREPIQIQPTATGIQVLFEAERKSALTWELFHSTGQLESQGHVNVQPGRNAFSIPLPAMPKTIYFIRIRSNGPTPSLFKILR